MKYMKTSTVLYSFWVKLKVQGLSFSNVPYRKSFWTNNGKMNICTLYTCTVPPVVVLIDLMLEIWFILYKGLNKPIVEYTFI
jgi:hypothetical protein